MRRGRAARGPERPKHRVNRHIRFPQIRVVDPEGEMLGIMSPEEGRAEARKRGLDLVEVSPRARPPVCRIMDYGKFKYDQKKARQAAKASSQGLKIVQLRPKTDDHDLATKLRRARRFLSRGDQVRLVMRMRGREQAYPQRWIEMLRNYVDEHLSDIANIAQRPSRQGRALTMLLEPA